MAPSASRFLSVSDLQARWSCGRTFIYAALGEMERAGYLRRLWLGRVQRVGLESIERWEEAHARRDPTPEGQALALPARPRRAEAASAGAAIRALRLAS